MTDFTDKQYVLAHKAWWPDSPDLPEILIQIRTNDKQADFSIVWEPNLDGSLIGKRLQIFDECWWLFESYPALFKMLHDSAGLDDPAVIINWLQGEGFTNATPYDDPYQENPENASGKP